MTRIEVVNLLLEIRHYVTEKTEAHDPYKMRNDIAEFLDNKTKEITE